MVKSFYQIIKSSRPRQWLKNLVLFAPLVFSGGLFEEGKFLDVFLAAIAFTFLTSSVYLLNDIIDLEKDRLHPFKKKRPIASGKLPLPTALFVTILGIFLSLYLAANFSFFFFLSCLTYLVLQIGYTIFLKRLAILDVLSIASGFILRVYAGALVINVHMTAWFLLTVISLSLLLAVGKRRSQLSENVFGVYISIFATSTFLSYALFTFLQPPVSPTIPGILSFLAVLPKTLTQRKWLMSTIPLVLYGMMRYLQLVYEKGRSESPEEILLSDKPLLITVILWGLAVMGIIYGVGR